jgi:hypothetical protein
VVSGYVKFRRGILEHLLAGLISADEYCAYSIIILLANHKNGSWMGSSKALSRFTKWSLRQTQAIVRSLRVKNYIFGECRKGIGSYRITVNKYFQEAHRDAQLKPTSAPGCATLQKEAHGDATVQEVVLQEEEGREKNSDAFGVKPANGAGTLSPPEIIETLGRNELKGLRTTLLRSVKDRRLPQGFRDTCQQKLDFIDGRIGRSA